MGKVREKTQKTAPKDPTTNPMQSVDCTSVFHGRLKTHVRVQETSTAFHSLPVAIQLNRAGGGACRHLSLTRRCPYLTAFSLVPQPTMYFVPAPFELKRERERDQKGNQEAQPAPDMTL